MQQEPLSAEMERLETIDLKAFPEAEEFIVDLRKADLATTLCYLVPNWGISISFPWWNRSRKDLLAWTFDDVPRGSLSAPFWDRDQGWNLLIWEVGDRVFVAEGDGDPDLYERWFTVPLDLYRSEWEKAIRDLQ